MAIYSKQKQKEISRLEQVAVDYYAEGFSFREISRKLGKSHQWVKLAVDKSKILPKSLENITT